MPSLISAKPRVKSGTSTQCRNLSNTFIACDYKESVQGLPQWLADWDRGFSAKDQGVDYSITSKSCSSECPPAAAAAAAAAASRRVCSALEIDSQSLVARRGCLLGRHGTAAWPAAGWQGIS
jgi:hypothetical protein